MRERALADFFKTVGENKSLQKEVGSIFANNEVTFINQPLANLAVKHGYRVTAEDMEQLRLAIKAQKEKTDELIKIIKDQNKNSDELSDEELDAVAGGVGITMALAAAGVAAQSFMEWYNN